MRAFMWRETLWPYSTPWTRPRSRPISSSCIASLMPVRSDHWRRNSVEVDPFPLDHQRPTHDLGVDRADVFAEDADEDELHGAEEEHADHQRRNTNLETVPEQQFIDQIPGRD